MVPVCNRPVMEYVIALLRRYGVDTVIITLHYLAEDIVSYFGDGSDFGVQIIYSVEDEPLGTAGSVKKVEEYLDDTFLVISGDGLTDLDLGRVLAYHLDKKAQATLTLVQVKNPLEYGVVITDEEGNISRFLEKPSWGEVFSDQVNTGIYVLEPSVLKLMEPGKAYDFSRDIFPKLLENKEKLVGHVASGYWCDIGDIEHYRQANQDMFRGSVLHEMAGSERERGIWIGEGCKIDPTAHLDGPLMIGRNCRIGAGTYISKYTCIGDNCIIESDAEINRSVVFNNVFIGKNSRVTRAIVSRQCTINSQVTLSDGAVVGESVFVGRGAQVVSNVKIWPEKRIEDGATVSSNLVWGTIATGVLFGQDGISGLGNIDITPEFAMGIGAAFGSILPKGSTVTTSRDAHPASRLTNRALISGLSSVGVNIFDLRLNSAPISRYAVRNGTPIGGVHARVDREDPRCIELEFFDTRGINIEKTVERKVENLFVRQDFRRTSMDEVGVISFSDDVLEDYIESFISYLDVEAIRRANFKVVIDYSHGYSSNVLPTILSRLGAETVGLNAYLDSVDARKATDNHDKSLKQLADIVGPLGADLGVLFDVDAERMSVVDERGQILTGNSLLSLMCLMIFRQGSDCLVAAPVNASRVLEDLATEHGGKIIRTKTDSRVLMHTARLGGSRIALAGTPNGGFIFPAFASGFDAMFAFARLLQMMASAKQPLSDLAKRIPNHYLYQSSVDCKWSAKAKVMRLIVEEYRDEYLEMLDGVRVVLKDGSMLIIPHPSLARLNIWAEAKTEARAKDLLNTATETVARLAEADDSQHYKVNYDTPGALNTLPEERAFHFWVTGRYLGIQARSLRTFVDVVHYVEAASLEYHMARNDFALWLGNELGRPLCARQLRELAATKCKGEELRRKLLQCLGEGENDLASE